MATHEQGAGDVRALAAKLGMNHSAVAIWLKRADWTFGPGPWDAATVARIEEWRRERLGGT